MKREVSSQDVEHLALLRANVELFLSCVSRKYSKGSALLLDVAPQDYKGARPFFGPEVEVETVDIDPASGATFIQDLCNCSAEIGAERYDFIVCTEVLEHTLRPFDAVENIYQLLKRGGMAFVTTPFNFRMHGPLPDCWRFTEYGLRELFRKFEVVELDTLECESRFLMPIQYSLVARKPVDDS